jgi:uncharacterized protein YuzE
MEGPVIMTMSGAQGTDFDVDLDLDLEANVAYIRLSRAPVMETIEINDLVNLDIDANGDPVGIELLSIDAEIPEGIFERSERPDATPYVRPRAIFVSSHSAGAGTLDRSYGGLSDDVGR